MRKVLFNPADLTDEDQKAWWKGWLERAKDARSDVLKAWKEWLQLDPDTRPPFDPAFDQNVWKDLKLWLLENVFHKRCAYCESPLQFDRYHGDAEHYRPKGAVTWRDLEAQPEPKSRKSKSKPKTRARCRLHDGREIDHPGYFWLAYDWRNLVPACSFCNSGAGKVDQFPAVTYLLQLDSAALAGQADALLPELEAPEKSSVYLLSPHTLDEKEQPLLLNPLNPSDARDPAKHLRYGLAGCVVAVDNSTIGKNSIAVYQLEREDLREGRQRAQERARRDYYFQLAQDPGPASKAALGAFLDKYRAGKEDFSSAALDRLREEQRSQETI